MRGRVLLWLAWVTPTVLLLARGEPWQAAAADAAVGIGLALVVATLPVPLWRLACFASLALVPFTAWWCAYVVITGGGPGYEAFQALLNTDRTEAMGAIRVAVRLPPVWLATLVHVAALVAACVVAVRGPAPAVWAHRRVRLAMLAGWLPLSALAVMNMERPDAPPGVVPLFGPATVGSPLGTVERVVAMQIHVFLWHREHHYARERARPGRIIDTPMLAVFALGESVRAGEFGPDRAARGPASAALAARIAAGLGAWLPETCAASNGTHLSVPMLLTATSPDRREDAARLPTVLGVLKADGFRTAWLANNDGGDDVREAGHDLYAGRNTIDPDDLARAGRDTWTYDEDALPTLRAFAAADAKPAAVLIHMIGSHLPYVDRYPRDEFPPEPPGLDAASVAALRYQRSVEHSAGVLVAIAGVLDADPHPAFMVYTSDHGENLAVDHNGLGAHLGPRTSLRDGTVPSFVLWNQPFAATGRPTVVLEKLRSRRQIAHLDVARAYLHLAGVRDGPVEPTATPLIWAITRLGDSYAVHRCTELEP